MSRKSEEKEGKGTTMFRRASICLCVFIFFNFGGATCQNDEFTTSRLLLPSSA
jgi:hypothetical protein